MCLGYLTIDASEKIIYNIGIGSKSIKQASEVELDLIIFYKYVKTTRDKAKCLSKHIH